MMTDIEMLAPAPEQTSFEKDSLAYKRLIWHSRRGMLELDLMFMPFVEEHFLLLSQGLQQDYFTLLKCEDQELFAWFVKKEPCTREDLIEIVSYIMEWYAKR